MSSLYQRGGVYWIQYYLRGKRIQRTLGTRSEREAILAQRQIDAALAGDLDVLGGGKARLGDVIDAYRQYAEKYYGRVLDTLEQALVRLGAHADLDAESFGPKALRRLRDGLVAEGLARSTINGYVGAIKRVFKWAVSEEMIPPATYQALASVTGLTVGRCDAVEPEPVGPVAVEAVEATCAVLDKDTADVLWLQMYTGARPGEILKLRPCDIDRSGEIWEATLKAHKTAHKGRARTLYFGPRAQEILKPRMLTFMQDVPMFRMTETALRSRVYRGCARAGVARWHPNQLRHTAATLVRKAYGLEAAQVILGHASADMTQIYAEKNADAARAVIKEIG